MAQRVALAVNKIKLKHTSCCCCIVILFLYHQLTVVFAEDVPEPTASSNTTMDQENNATFLEPIAEALIRYRRHPPRTIVKHIIRPKRVKVKRVKRPKIKYSFAEPPPTIYYRKAKPSLSYSHAPPTYDSSIYEDFSHINVESADFDLPPSSYETHSMDLDLYKNYESAAETVYKESDKPTAYTYSSAPEISYKEPAKIPSYSYSSSSKGERKPHAEYGVPTEFTYNTGYDKPSGNSYSYEEEHIQAEKPSSYSSGSSGYEKSPSSGYSYSKPSSYEEQHPGKLEEHPSSYPSEGYEKSPGGYSYEEPSYKEQHPSKIAEYPLSHPSEGYEKSPSGYSYEEPSYKEQHPGKLAEHPSSYPSEGYEKSHGSGYAYQEPSYEEHSNKITEQPSSYSGGGHESEHPSSYSGGGHESGHEGGHDGGHDGGYSYQAPSHEPSPTYSHPGKEEYSYSPPQSHAPPPPPHPPAKPPRIPATKYGVPDLHLPPPKLGDYHKYSVVQQKAPSSSSYQNKHHFAEPPETHKPSVEITYSPSYEINVPSPGDGPYHRGYESAPPQQYDHYPAPQPPANYHPGLAHQESSDTHQPATYEPAPSQDLPIDQNHRHPNYDYPKSSYEVPIYDPIPFDSSTQQEREVYPPQPFDNNSWQEASQTEYAAEPNNVSEQKPSEAMETPRQPESDEMPHEDAHSSGTRTQSQSAAVKPPPRPQRTRKRKRTKGSSSTTLATTKHILDVPELEEAFEKEKRNNYPSTDTDINASHKVVKINNGPWNPMRIRTPAISVTTPPTTRAINQYQTPPQPGGRNHSYQHRIRSTTTTTESPPPPPPPQAHPPKQQHHSNHIPNIEIVSIEKSRSKTYYDGILSTPKIYNTNFYRNRYKTSSHQQPPPPVTSTIAPAARGSSSSSNMERFSKRTTKNVFDTTIFKSPLTDRDVYQNLPKNHKLF